MPWVEDMIAMRLARGGVESTPRRAKWDFIGADVVDDPAGGRKIITITGTFDPTRYGAVGDGVADDTAALNLAIAAANAAGGTITLGRAHRITAALTPLAANNVVIRGLGDYNGGTTILVDSVSPIDAITVSAQHAGVRDVYFRGARVHGSGNAVKFLNCFGAFAENVRADAMGNGIDVNRCVRTTLRNVQLRGLFGTYGLRYIGASGAVSHSLNCDNWTCDNPFPYALIAPATAWVGSQAVSQGAVRIANGNVWQCSTAGTTAASGGPSGFPTTDPATVFTTEVTDGTAKWRYVCSSLAWMRFDSYANSLNCTGRIQLINGWRGLHMVDSAGSAPSILNCSGSFEVDHATEIGVFLEHGTGATLDNPWISSVQAAWGVRVHGSFGYDWHVDGGVVFGCAQAGISVAQGRGGVTGTRVGNCGTLASNTMDGVQVDAGISNFRIEDVFSGDLGQGGNTQRYGISVGAGASDHYRLTGLCPGNLTGGHSDGGSGVNKHVSVTA
jgi:hypothetical protein